MMRCVECLLFSRFPIILLLCDKSETNANAPPQEPSIAKRIVDKMRSISSLRTLAKKDKRF